MSERLSWTLWIAGVAAIICAHVCGCRPGEDRLAAAIAISNATAAALDQANRQHEARVAAAYLERAATCPDGAERRACLVAAGQAALAATAEERTRLVMLALAQQTAAAALEAAAACRRDALACEDDELRRAERPLAQARAGLRGGNRHADGGAP